jgi:hypothetical protein
LLFVDPRSVVVAATVIVTIAVAVATAAATTAAVASVAFTISITLVTITLVAVAHPSPSLPSIWPSLPLLFLLHANLVADAITLFIVAAVACPPPLSLSPSPSLLPLLLLARHPCSRRHQS